MLKCKEKHIRIDAEKTCGKFNTDSHKDVWQRGKYKIIILSNICVNIWKNPDGSSDHLVKV